MSRADIAILTVIPEEYEAVIASLSSYGCRIEHVPGSSTAPNQFGWVTCDLRGANDQVYRIVVGMVAQPGPARMASATSATCARYKPRYVLVVGIAGGFPQDGLAKGDVVISSVIYDYEYGKVATSFQPRMDFTYQPDQTLLTSAASLHARDKSWAERDKHLRPDGGDTVPKLLQGAVASGGKVVDDAGNDFFAAVLKAWPKLLAVEMEGAGVAAAIETEKGAQTVGFLMVRAISDMPKMRADTQPTVTDTQPTTAPPEGNKAERDKWKKYAATMAANFTIHWISHAWPLVPRPTRRPSSSAAAEEEDDPPSAKELAGLSSSGDQPLFSGKRIALVGAALAVGATMPFWLANSAVQPAMARLPLGPGYATLARVSEAYAGMGTEFRSWEELESKEDREAMLAFTDRFVQCPIQFVMRNPASKRTGIRFDVDIKRGANSKQLILRDVVVEVVRFHSIAPTFWLGAAMPKKPLVVVEMYNQRTPLPWTFRAKWIADSTEGALEEFEGHQVLIERTDWETFLLKLEVKDRGIYEFNIDLVLQQDDEPQRTVRVTEKPIAVGFFARPEKTHPDYKFLHDLYMARGGMMQQRFGLE